MILKIIYLKSWYINISYAYGTSEVGLVPFSVLSNHRWLVATKWNSTILKQNYLDSELYTSPVVQVLMPTCIFPENLLLISVWMDLWRFHILYTVPKIILFSIVLYLVYQLGLRFPYSEFPFQESLVFSHFAATLNYQRRNVFNPWTLIRKEQESQSFICIPPMRFLCSSVDLWNKRMCGNL